MKTKKMLNVHFFLLSAESNQNPDNQLTIKYQLEIEGQLRDTSLTTSIKVPHRFWWAYKKHKLSAPPISKDGRQQFVLPSYFEAEEINQKLHEIRATYKEIFASIQTFSEATPTYTEVRERFDPKTRKATKKTTPKFLEVLNEMVPALSKKRKWSDGTLKNYEKRQDNIKEFFKNHGYSRLLISEVKYRHIEQLLEWMTEQVDENGNERFGQDHRNKHATAMKTVLEYAVNNEYLTHLPISKLNLTYSDCKPPAYLRFNDRILLEKCDAFSVQKVKDIAIFLMYTGFSYTDYLSLTPDNLEGACWKKQRDKSETFALPPLLPKAAAIITKYGGIDKLPKLDISDMNKALKHLGDYSNLNTNTVGFNLSTSVFRETFASMLENEYMIDRKLIKFMMGHKTDKQLKNYSTLGTGKILHEMQKSADTLHNHLHQEYQLFIEKIKNAA